MHFSIIIPTLNQARKLSLCLQHLYELNFDQELFEVLVIDNGSTDNTKDLSLSFDNHIANLYYHYCAEPGLMAARHMGAEKARGDVLCYLDDDSMVSKDWLNGHKESFLDEKVVISGGPCIPEYEVDPPDWVEYFWHKTEFGYCHNYLSLVDFGNKKIEIDPKYIFGCNYAIRKSIFYELGGTRPDYYPEKYRHYQGSGETSLALGIQNAGLKAFYHPEARIDHLIPETRFTHEYFYFKRFFIGIGASYQWVRQNNGLDGYTKPSFSVTDEIISKIRKPLGRIKRGVIGFVKRIAIKNQEPQEILSIREKMDENFQNGYAYHQRMLEEEPKLLEWVLRDNYLGENGKLPI